MADLACCTTTERFPASRARFIAAVSLALILSFVILAFPDSALAQKKNIVDGTFWLRSRHEVLDAQIRAKLAGDKTFATQLRARQRVSAQMVEDQTKATFQIYNFGNGRYEPRACTLKGIGTTCYIFVADDSLTYLGNDPATTIRQIRDAFDAKVYPTITDWFGTVNIPARFNLPDQKIYILLSDILDGLGGGYVAGFFDSRDLEGDLGNSRPMFFMDIREGKTGDPNDKTNDFYRTLAHEFQHMINFSKHLPEAGRVQEDRWVEEGLSGFAEYVYTAQIGNDGVGLAPSPHLARFLEYPQIVLTNNSDSEWFSEATLFRHYGASFLFAYYLQEKYGGTDDVQRKAFLRSVVDNASTGINGLNAVLATRGTTFIEVLKNWFVANHLNDPSVNNGLWGYVDKDTRLGVEAKGLPLPGKSHTFAGSGLSFIGGEGQTLSNAAKYESISGSGNLQIQFKGRNYGFTPFVATIDFSNNTAIRNILLDDGFNGALALDLSVLKRVILVPAVATTQADIGATFNYTFSGGSKVVVYPIPNPVFANEFIIVVKSQQGALNNVPTVSVSFNNINSTPSLAATDDSKTVYVGNYTVPGPGEGVVTVTIGEVSSSFSFFSASIRANTLSKLKVKDAEFSISSRNDGESVFLYESALVEVPNELQIISKPYFTSFNSQSAIEARLLFENPAVPVDRLAQMGLWSNKVASQPWNKVSQNERGVFCPVHSEGLYVLVADKTAPKIHDLHVDAKEERPVLRARISDGGSGINHDSIRVEADGQSLPFALDRENGVITADLTRLSRGQHRFQVEVSDLAENLGKNILTQVLAGPLSVVQVTAYPNPSRGAANLAVILDGSGADDPTLEIEARVYDVSGAKILNMPFTYKANRTFVARWNHRNEDGKTVANGMYLFKVIVHKGGEELKSTGKIAVLN
jgi:hypothetical protein